MPRTARQRSDTGIYHVILRGIARQDIFETDDDRQMFLRMLREVAIYCDDTPDAPEQQTLTIYAYCLMSNHIHLLVKEHFTTEDDRRLREGSPNVKVGISATMHRLGRKYTMYYNKLYGRSGTLFDDRFKSEPIADLRYFLTCFVYIHRNPIKAAICPKVEDYPWSSWFEYQRQPTLCATHVILAHWPLPELHKYMNEDPSTQVMDIDDAPPPVSEKAAKQMLSDLTHCDTPHDFQQLPKEQQREYARQLFASNLTIAQIARITGMTYRQVYYHTR